MRNVKSSIVATLLVMSGLVFIVLNLINHRLGRDPNPFSDISTNSLTATIEQFAVREGWLLVPQPESVRLSSEARAYEKKQFRNAARAIVFRTNASIVIVWIEEKGEMVTVAHIRIYGDYDPGLDKLFALLRPLVPFSSAGEPPLTSKGEQVMDANRSSSPQPPSNAIQ